MAKNIKNDAITSRDENFAQWYTDVCRKAELMDYSSVKGFIIYRPYGYAMWEQIQNYMDKRFKETGHENVYMPLVIPESLLQKEKDHVEGFAPECAVVTRGGVNELEENLIIRPTSETLFSEHYAKIVKSYRDLPKKYNQWCSVVRWEKTTRPFLRGSEFLWQEGHTVHATEEEARKETLQMRDIYLETAKDVLAIPMLTGRKTDKEKFAGAEETYTIEALMHDGKVLQSGTSHYFGQGFAEAFGIQFLDKDNKQKFVHQTSWGVSTRLLGAIIMVHGDDNGLVLPPRVAPTQVVIVPIMQKKEGVLDKAYEMAEQLKKQGIRVKVDDSDKSPGWKFSEAEMRGIPVRIEVGPRDIENGQCIVAKRNDGKKETVALDEHLGDYVINLMNTIHDEMYKKAEEHLQAHITHSEDFNEFGDILDNKGGYIETYWCGDLDCEMKVKDEYQATSRCYRPDEAKEDAVCPCCGKKAKHIIYYARAY
ncbi:MULTISPECIES: proline--tRNA ligase [Kandleria]|jgi:prolyl-tRNA synthetase|uniref:Proline--tRNA ligase n=1 Tax=Kandleria vitulina DSM 20405 TaxID=1410657 RepID=A0A0R2HAY9_9FIRM|nr:MULTISPECIES: proline--tRNA ligase [Kandleria]KRN50128.1 prolyl-tRNA synthetase [Kandleria vitulina DSM 20405]MBP3277124.1 proline--tRNA ligase [Kandleria sp.]MEE0989023.1 proline--tRNA ligase [Kandleria vitulina]SDL75005.1 prolyl-tRNA synthetase [Kandleria vitulina]HAD23368.1 proline--tRNA ligase [Kandleria vitulina]